MPARQNVKTIETPVEIQGTDAWVKIKSITIEEAKMLQNLSIKIDNEIKPERERLFNEYAKENELDVKTMTDDDKSKALINSSVAMEAEKFLYDYYSDYVLAWNWVTEFDDKDGNPIPMEQPKNNPGVFNKLTAQEFSYVQSLFQQDTKDEKKLS